MKISLLHLLLVLSDTGEKQNLMTKQQCTVPDSIKFFGTPCISHFFESLRSWAWEQKNSKSPSKEYCSTREEK